LDRLYNPSSDIAAYRCRVLVEGHYARASVPLPRRHLRLLLLAGLLAAALLVAVLAGAVANTQPAASTGCRHVTVAMTTGGATIEHCGPRAGR
jgi:hypothetical protein